MPLVLSLRQTPVFDNRIPPHRPRRADVAFIYVTKQALNW